MRGTSARTGLIALWHRTTVHANGGGLESGKLPATWESDADRAGGDGETGQLLDFSARQPPELVEQVG
jgi:hypothetical protein